MNSSKCNLVFAQLNIGILHAFKNHIQVFRILVIFYIYQEIVIKFAETKIS